MEGGKGGKIASGEWRGEEETLEERQGKKYIAKQGGKQAEGKGRTAAGDKGWKTNKGRKSKGK